MAFIATPSEKTNSYTLGRCWMRLVCVNCDAEYEVDAAAIPLTGRDVQCSNCGHGWFQPHPDALPAHEADPDIFEMVPQRKVAADPDDETWDDDASEEIPEIVGPVGVNLTKPADDVMPAPVIPPVPRTLDDTVMAVLREEAEREAAARRAEAAAAKKAPVIETQTEMPLTPDQGATAAQRIARLRGAEAEPVVPPPAPKSRRDMLPAIEEINSTLRASGDRKSDADSALFETQSDTAASQAGFRRGFLLLLTLAVILVLMYIIAPMVGTGVPALAGIADGYVRAVDGARIWLDAELRALIAALRGLAGGQGG
ncbi:MAG: zinc-ribbon domain-containing protein [Candidatus Saccharibacteria bacterium]|nr:zinc-ribbon domain-containing protein [Pseudorhodobacter sp.]